MTDQKENRNNLKDYLLGRIEDDSRLAEIEDRLASDEAFFASLETTEQELIERYLDGGLDGDELEAFERLFLSSKSRRREIEITRALRDRAFESGGETRSAGADPDSDERGFFQSFGLTAKLAFGAVTFSFLFILVYLGWMLVADRSAPEHIVAELDRLNGVGRPVEGRIVDFTYQPYRNLRGEDRGTDEAKRLTFRKLENRLIEAIERSSSSENHHNLGVLYLTQGRLDDAIKEFEHALEINDQNSAARSDLGIALYEKSKLVDEEEEKLRLKARALEESSKAINEGQTKPETLFNKALILQEMNIPRQAIEAWKEYLERDGTSKWADEARKNLAELEAEKNSSFKSRQSILGDFLGALERDDETAAWKIHSQTKEFNSGKFLPLQLARSYLESDSRRDRGRSEKHLEAMQRIGVLEKRKNADVFFYDLAGFYARLTEAQKKTLLRSHRVLTSALEHLDGADYENANRLLNESRRIFASVGDEYEAHMLDVPIAFTLTRLGKLEESNRILREAERYARANAYKWLLSAALDWIASNLSIEIEISKAVRAGNETLRISLETGNVYEIQRISGGLAQIHYEVGETRHALRHISRAISYDDLYNQSLLQAWRNYKHGSELFGVLGLHETSIAFGREYLALAEENDLNPSLIQLSRIYLAQSYLNKRDLSKARELLDESRALGEGLTEGFQQKFHDAMIKMTGAHVRRLEGDCDAALRMYDEAIGIFEQLSEIIYELYVARKGKLACYQETGRTDQLGRELEEVLEIFESNRRKIVEESSRNVFFDLEQTVYDIAVEHALRQGDERLAFEYAERSKARSLLDFVTGGAKITNGGIEYTGVARPLSLPEIQRRMPADAQIVQYAVLPGKIVIWLVDGSKIARFETRVEAGRLELLVGDHLKRLIDKRGRVEQSGSRSDELFRLLIEPVLSSIDRRKDVYLIPDKSLHRLPFGSLRSEQRGRYLIEELKLGVTPSATVFTLMTERARRQTAEENLVSVGNPSFDKTSNPDLKDLKSAAREASKIAGYYRRAEPLIGSEATRAKMLERLNRAEVFHFAGHYVANQRSPLHSKLLISDTGAGGEEESGVRVLEIARKKAEGLKLVVLSACQTDVEQYYNGEGAVGAARIFLGIGAPVVVASHYAVDSDATADLMIGFHRYRKVEGMDVNDALRKAQLDMLADPDEERRDPFYWAAFSAIGGHTLY